MGNESSARPTLYAEWPDLPRFSGATIPVAKWGRWRVWAGGPLRYDRPSSVDIAVTPEGHAFLRDTLRAVTAELKAVEAEIRRLDAEGAFVGPAEAAGMGRRVWPRDITARLMTAATDRWRAEGVVENTSAWWARERGLARALVRLRWQAINGRQLRLDLAPGDLSPAPTCVRLAVGEAHLWSPRPEADGLLDFREAGKVCLIGEPVQFDPVDCAYVEVAQWEQAWHARFIFAQRNQRQVKHTRPG